MEDSPPSTMLELTIPFATISRNTTPLILPLSGISHTGHPRSRTCWSLETENKQLHSEVTDLKKMLFEMKQDKNMHLQTTSTDSPLLQTKLNNLQKELKSQQALLKQET